MVVDPTFGALIDVFLEEENIGKILKLKPGERSGFDLSFSTALSYRSMITTQIRPKWGEIRLSKIKPIAIQDWLRKMDRAPKTKGHIKALMHRLFEKAMLYEYIETQKNPMSLVEIRGISKRTKKPTILTLEQFYQIVDQLQDPWKTMVMVAMCLGLRVNEILALKWSDIDFPNLSMRVTRAVVHGRVKDVKTEYSEDDLPLDESFAEILLAWKAKCPTTLNDWMFPSNVGMKLNGGKPYHASPIQQDYIKPAGRKVGLSAVGWHTFRHTYRTWLDSTGAPIGVQQKLMRHAQVSTTMDVYGTALMESKREANSKIVRMAVRKKEEEAVG